LVAAVVHDDAIILLAQNLKTEAQATFKMKINDEIKYKNILKEL
jgi:hypothetical protein